MFTSLGSNNNYYLGNSINLDFPNQETYKVYEKDEKYYCVNRQEWIYYY
jgi:hypothetical protein